MPRDIGTGLYHYPDGTPGNAGQTVFSARYNTFINDLSNTLNQALPVNMGGTGGTDGATARDNLDAEVSGKQVTDYSTHVFEPGSFYSLTSAVSEPVDGHAFAGICYGVVDLVTPANNKLVIEARDLDDTATPGLKYVREKIGAAAWSAWSLADSGAYVLKAGDTMTGALTVTPKGSMFGGVGGTVGTGAVVPADANIKFYDLGSGNWSGMGVDGNGLFWLRTGGSGTPVPAVTVSATGQIGMTGNLTINAALPIFTLNDTGTSGSYIQGQRSGSARWNVAIGGLAACDFIISRANDAGAVIDDPLSISRATGIVTILNDLFANRIGVGTSPTFATLEIFATRYNGASSNAWVNYDTNAAAGGDGVLYNYRNGVNVGGIQTSLAATSFNTASDSRRKEDERSFDLARKVIDDLKIWDFRWKNTDTRSVGLFAQDAYEVFAEAVSPPSETQGDVWLVDYSKFVPVLISDAQETHARIASLEQQVVTLMARIEALEAAQPTP